MLRTKCALQSNNLRVDQKHVSWYVNWLHNCHRSVVKRWNQATTKINKYTFNQNLLHLIMNFWHNDMLLLRYWHINGSERRDSFHQSQEGGQVPLGLHSVCSRLEPGNVQAAVTFIKLLVSQEGNLQRSLFSGWFRCHCWFIKLV